LRGTVERWGVIKQRVGAVAVAVVAVVARSVRSSRGAVGSDRV
jgi:hypothetical protein